MALLVPMALQVPKEREWVYVPCAFPYKVIATMEKCHGETYTVPRCYRTELYLTCRGAAQNCICTLAAHTSISLRLTVWLINFRGAGILKWLISKKLTGLSSSQCHKQIMIFIGFILLYKLREETGTKEISVIWLYKNSMAKNPKSFSVLYALKLFYAGKNISSLRKI